MTDAAEQFVSVDDVFSTAYNDPLQPSSSGVPVYWCHNCNLQVVPRGGRVMVCPECGGENILQLGPLGLPSPSANGLRYRGRHRVASESDLSRLGGGNDNDWQSIPPSLSGVLMGHNQSGSNNGLFMPAARIRLFGRWGHDWEDYSNDRAFVGDNHDGRLGYFGGGNGQFPTRPWDPPTSIQTRSPEPTWQQFMQEMLQSFLRRGDGAVSNRAVDHASDPGDYMDDSRGFDRLLSELAENDHDDHGPPPAAEFSVNKLPFIAIEQQHIDDDSATCPVCKDRMELGEMAKELPCHHLYHEICILPWLKVRNSCPVCRFELPTDDAEYEARKHAARNNTQSMVGQERGGANGIGLRVASPQEDSDEGMRFYGVEEIEEEFEAHPVEQSRRHDSWRGGWLWFAARPLLSIVGIVLAFTFGHRLIAAQEPIGNQLATAQLSSNARPDLDGSL